MNLFSDLLQHISKVFSVCCIIIETCLKFQIINTYKLPFPFFTILVAWKAE